jgi:hypothetical protein
VGGRLTVVNDRVAGDHDSIPSPPRTPAEVNIVAEERQSRIEAIKCIPYVPTDEHASAAYRENVAPPIVLALVELATFKPVHLIARARHGDTNGHELVLVVPTAQLGSEHLCGSLTVGREQ